MRCTRIVGGGVAAMAAAALLPACQVDKQFGATCSTSPPVPHQENGSVFVSVDVPLKVEAGSTFTVTVDAMGGDPGPEGGESMPHGQLGVTGGVLPSGTFAVGQGPFGGAPFPVDLAFTAAGDPGDRITLTAISGSSVIGQLPNASLATCTPFGDATIGAIEIVAPADPQDFVLGAGSVELDTGAVSDFDIEVRGGAQPTGAVSIDGLFADAPPTCLEVRTMGTGTEFDEATTNLQTAELGLVTLQVSDGNPEGLPDTLSAITSSSRSPDDCSRIAFGSEDLQGFVRTGDVHLFNAEGP